MLKDDTKASEPKTLIQIFFFIDYNPQFKFESVCFFRAAVIWKKIILFTEI